MKSNDIIITANKLNFKNIIKYPDISIKYNKATFIYGESGVGKSILLQLLNGVVSVKEGEIIYHKKNINTLSPIELRKDILLCNQSVFLFDDTIENNFKKFYNYKELPHLTQEQMKYYLELCCINFNINSDCVSMSGGERHRIFIAICLSFIPAVLMLDEPTSALDNQNANAMLSTIKKFCSEHSITLIIVCHDKSLVDKYADNIIYL